MKRSTGLTFLIAFLVILVFVLVATVIFLWTLQNDLKARTQVVPAGITPTAIAALVDTATPAPAVTLIPFASATSGAPAPATAAAVATDTVAPPASPTATKGPAIPFTFGTPTATPTGAAGAATPIVATGETVTPTGSPTLEFTPTAIWPLFAFNLDGGVKHDTGQSCLGEYLRGTVRDRNGNPLAGIGIKAYDLYGNQARATSKGGTDMGKWDIVLGATPNIWSVVVIDGAGNPISPVASVPHHQEGQFKAACVHIVDWRRSN